MSSKIIDLIKDQFGPTIINQASSRLGESESGISKAIGALIPIVLAGFANNSDKPSVLDSISNSSSGILGNLFENTSNNSVISTLLTSIFGDKVGGLVSTISNFAGISNSSTNSLLNTVTGGVLGSLGNYSAENNLGSSGITSLLNDQKGIISSLLPAGLSLGSLGFGNWFGASDGSSSTPKYTSETTNSTRQQSRRVENNSGNGMNWLKWLIPLALLLIVGGYLMKKCSEDKIATENSEEVLTDTVEIVETPVENNVTPVRVAEEVDLNGTKLKAYQGGLEGQLISYLNSGEYDTEKDENLKDKWYTFDNVNFKMGSSTELEDGSQTQLDNLVAILKAFPNAKIKIGGYTDKVGDATKNKILSQERADFIKNSLSKAGVGSQVLSAEGYGSEHATIPAEASDEERAVDRKMAIRFAK